MKNLKYRVTVTLAITTFFLFGFCARLVMSAESYLGNVCWRADQTLPGPDVFSWTYKLGLYKKDGGHFTLYGTEHYIEPSTGLVYTGVVHGNMEVIGNNFYAHLVSIGSAEEELNDIDWLYNIGATLSINPFTLSGPFKSILDDGSFDWGGTMTLIPCP